MDAVRASVGSKCLAFPRATGGPDLVSRDASVAGVRFGELLGHSVHVAPLDGGDLEVRLTSRSLVGARIAWIDLPSGLKIALEKTQDNLTVLFVEQGSISFSSDSGVLASAAGSALALNTATFELVTCTAGLRCILFTLPMTVFAGLIESLFDRPWHRDVDVIFCRNGLIYFDRPTQQAVIDRLISHLRPGGYLILGHSESMAGSGVPGLSSVAPTVYQATPAPHRRAAA